MTVTARAGLPRQPHEPTTCRPHVPHHGGPPSTCHRLVPVPSPAVLLPSHSLGDLCKLCGLSEPQLLICTVNVAAGPAAQAGCQHLWSDVPQMFAGPNTETQAWPWHSARSQSGRETAIAHPGGRRGEAALGCGGAAGAPRGDLIQSRGHRK